MRATRISGLPGLLAAGLLFSAAGCSEESKQADAGPAVQHDAGKEEPDAGKEQPDAGGEFKCEPGTCTEEVADLLTGFFGVEAVVNAQVILKIDVKQYILLEYEQTGKKLKEKTTVCEFNLPSVEGIAEIDLPEAVQELIRSKAQEREGDFLNCAGPGATYDPPSYTVTLGFDTENCDLATDPLPTKDDTACMKDEDGDGKPGVTVLVKAMSCPAGEKVDLYVAMRSVIDFCGRVEDANNVSGLLEPQFEQSILGYSDDCLAMAEGLAVDITGGSFTAKRVDANGDINLDANSDGRVDCAEFSSRVEEVFPEEE